MEGERGEKRSATLSCPKQVIRDKDGDLIGMELLTVW